jgi:hypothetical protein
VLSAVRVIAPEPLIYGELAAPVSRVGVVHAAANDLRIWLSYDARVSLVLEERVVIEGAAASTCAGATATVVMLQTKAPTRTAVFIPRI